MDEGGSTSSEVQARRLFRQLPAAVVEPRLWALQLLAVGFGAESRDFGWDPRVGPTLGPST